MKNSDVLYLAFLNIKRSKFRSVLFILFTFLVLMLGSIALNYQYSMNTYVDNYLNNSIYARTIYVGNPYEEDRTSFFNRLYKYDHISYVYNQNKVYKEVYFNNFPISDNTYATTFLPIGGDFKLNIVKGHDIQDDYDIICPVNMVIQLGNNNDVLPTSADLYDISDWVGKEIDVTYYKKKMKNLEEGSIINTYNQKFKLVGVYDTVNSYDSYSTCYMKDNVLEEIVDESQTIYMGEYKSITDHMETAYKIIVDDPRNTKQVYQQLVDDGWIYPTIAYDTDLTAFKIIDIVVLVVTLLVLVLSCLIFYIFLNKNIKDYQYDIGLYKTFGFKNKIISKIMLYQSLILSVFSYILCLITSIIVCYVIDMSLNNDLNNLWLNALISPIYMIIIFIVLLLICVIIARRGTKKIEKMEVKKIFDEDNI